MTAPRAPRRRGRRWALNAGVGSVALSLVFVTGGYATNASAADAFTKTETIDRTHLVGGADQAVEKRTFQVAVDKTSNLRDRQEINVSWTGAHPTGGLVGDQNSGLAAEQEYPIVLMQCRGVDSASAPSWQRVSPETCWTHTPSERAQSDLSFIFPSYRLDRYAPASDRRIQVGVPSPLPSDCNSSASGAQHWIPFVAGDKTVYPGGPSGCGGMPPESVTYEGALQPSNTTYGATDKNGRGSSKFAIASSETNASLGCSYKVACSLVIIPIMGISCDPAAADLPEEDRPSPKDVYDEAFSRCSAEGKYQPGEFSPGTVNQEDLAVAGELWWSASNWRNRISVPLGFAQPANICNLVSRSAPVYVYGSELMLQATLQWAPRFCLDRKLFKLQHVQTGEPQAKNLLETGSIDAALAGGPPQTPFGRPIVQAPAALTGFVVTFVIDDGSGHQRHELRLTPRILAKLMTESYPAHPSIQGNYDALSHNPLTLADDPEFRALNPGGSPPGYNTEPAATLFSISSDSDVISALTSYIDVDPEARAFLDGAADPWGMVVNPNYKGIELPVLGWPLLDRFQSGPIYSSDSNPCLSANPVPFLPLVAAPVSSLATVTLNMQFGIANSQVKCNHPGEVDQKLVAMGREKPGQRFILGVTSLADAERYQLDAASLMTHVASNAPARFSDSTGRTFVAPNDATLRAAAKLLRGDEAAGTWLVPYGFMRADVKGEAAYPGTMLMSIDVPTSGLSKVARQFYAKLLQFVASKGQVRGTGNGQLPPGYLPLTASNGMAAQVKYTQLAAVAVAAQSGTVPSVRTLRLVIPKSGGSSGGGSVSAPPLPVIVPPAGSVPTGVVGAPGVPNGRPLPAAVAGKTLGFGIGLAGLVFPIVLLLAFLGALAGALTWLMGRPKVVTM